VTVPDAVTVGVRSDITTITVSGSNYTGDNNSKFLLREGKILLSYTETVKLFVRKETDLW